MINYAGSPSLSPVSDKAGGMPPGNPALGATDSEIAGDLMKELFSVEFSTMQNQQ